MDNRPGARANRPGSSANRSSAQTRALASLGLLGAAVLGALAAAGCRPAASPEAQARAEWCEQNAESVVELIPQGMQPTRPNQTINVVEAYWFATEEGKVHTLRVKACKLGADAVVDVTPPPQQTQVVTQRTVETWHGTATETTVEPGPQKRSIGRGYAIRYTDVPPRPTPGVSQAPLPGAPPPPPALTAPDQI